MNIDIEVPRMIKIEFEEFLISAQCDKAVLLPREAMVRNSFEAKFFLCFSEKKKIVRNSSGISLSEKTIFLTL